MTKNLILILGLMILALPLMAIGDDAGTSGFSSLKIIYSARANAMAGAFTSRDDDIDVIFFNPANLGGYEANREVSSTFMSYFDGYNGGSVVYQYKRSEKSNVAVFGQFLASDEIKRTISGENGGYLDAGTYDNSDFIAGANYSYYFNEQLNVGFSGKYIQETIDDKSASAIAFDLGILHRPVNEKIRVGAAIRNIGAQLSYFTDSEYNEGMPIVYAGGISYKTDLKTRDNEADFIPSMLVSLDLSLAQGSDLTGLIGTEFQVHEQFLVRVGYKTNAGDYKNGGDNEIFSGLSTGVGFVRNNLRVDYALNSYGDLGFINQVTLKYQF
ncbi:PorV/PorQ family protein [bacterium]|nr:PorV/PorQ family protein [bacterium]